MAREPALLKKPAKFLPVNMVVIQLTQEDGEVIMTVYADSVSVHGHKTALGLISYQSVAYA